MNKSHVLQVTVTISLFFLSSVSCTTTKNGDIPATPTRTLPSITNTASPTSAAPTVTTALSSTPSPTRTHTPTQSQTFTKTIEPSITPTYPFRQKTKGSYTPFPSLPAPTAYDLLQRYIIQPKDCKLPCWWGITPGKTTWEEAQRILMQLTSVVGVSYDDKDTSTFSAGYFFPFPEKILNYNFPQTYEVRNGIVEVIYVHVEGLSYYRVAALLSSYGVPSDVKLRTFRNYYMGSIPFYLRIYYKEQGILAGYKILNAFLVGDQNRACFQQEPAFSLVLVPKEKNLSLEEAGRYTDLRIDETSFKYLSLTEATKLDNKGFYQRFKDLDGMNCLDTPKDLWPGQFE